MELGSTVLEIGKSDFEDDGCSDDGDRGLGEMLEGLGDGESVVDS